MKTRLVLLTALVQLSITGCTLTPDNSHASGTMTTNLYSGIVFIRACGCDGARIDAEVNVPEPNPAVGLQDTPQEPAG